MARNVADREEPETKRLRKEAGAYVKKLRLARDMTQKDLADKVGIAYYTFVSQIENGQGSVPSHQYEHFAKALGVPVVDFVKTMLRLYDPYTFKLLFRPDGSERKS